MFRSCMLAIKYVFCCSCCPKYLPYRRCVFCAASHSPETQQLWEDSRSPAEDAVRVSWCSSKLDNRQWKWLARSGKTFFFNFLFFLGGGGGCLTSSLTGHWSHLALELCFGNVWNVLTYLLSTPWKSAKNYQNSLKISPSSGKNKFAAF